MTGRRVTWWIAMLFAAGARVSIVVTYESADGDIVAVQNDLVAGDAVDAVWEWNGSWQDATPVSPGPMARRRYGTAAAVRSIR